jgi:predicted PurR-regulated permease PerM
MWERVSNRDLTAAIALAVGVAALRLGRPVLMPLALALLVSFSLAPIVERLERRRLGRIPSVIAVCALIVMLFGGIGYLVGRQAASIIDEYPRYRVNLREKVHALRGPIGSLSGAAAELDRLGQEMEEGDPGRPAAKVEVVEPPRVLGKIGELLTPVLGPLATVGLVAVLALFMLLEREELRDRLIWLTGAKDLSLTTNALDDAAQRVSRYLLTQSLLCGMHGLAVGIGLALIGIPGAVLWGALAALLRFLPYFGPWIAAALPIALSLALPGWQAAALTISLLVLLELVSNNVLEPRMYGASVGLSPFAVVFSAVFWTWLWGIPGLLLATPLTVCLVVAGRYLGGLEYLSVLLSDRPALSPETRLYQRLLALDLDEAAEVLRDAAREASLEEVSDSLVLPVLRRLAHDDQREALPDEKSTELRQKFEELLEELLEEVGATAASEDGPRVLFVPALDATEELAGRWLARVVAARGDRAQTVSIHALSSEVAERAETEADVVCLSALTPRAIAHARRLAKRLVGRGAHEVLLACWAAAPHEMRNLPQSPDDPRVRWIGQATALRATLDSVRARAPSVPTEPAPGLVRAI